MVGCNVDGECVTCNKSMWKAGNVRVFWKQVGLGVKLEKQGESAILAHLDSINSIQG